MNNTKKGMSAEPTWRDKWAKLYNDYVDLQCKYVQERLCAERSLAPTIEDQQWADENFLRL